MLIYYLVKHESQFNRRTFIFDIYCCVYVTFSVKVMLAPLKTEETVGDFCGVLLPPICVEVYVQVLTVWVFF